MNHDHYGFFNFLFDVFMTAITGGLWLLYLLFKALHK